MHGDGNEIIGRIVSNAHTMMETRGYAVDHVATNVLRAMEHALPLLACTRDGVPTAHVYLVAEDKVGVKTARQILDASSHAIVISPEGATAFTRKECESKRGGIQFMRARDLCFNVTEHALVPRHELCGAPPVGIDTEMLPGILDTDPIVQYYDWPVGSVVRITRLFGGSEPIPYFRVVVAAN